MQRKYGFLKVLIVGYRLTLEKTRELANTFLPAGVRSSQTRVSNGDTLEETVKGVMKPSMYPKCTFVIANIDDDPSKNPQLEALRKYVSTYTDKPVICLVKYNVACRCDGIPQDYMQNTDQDTYYYLYDTTTDMYCHHRYKSNSDSLVQKLKDVDRYVSKDFYSIWKEDHPPEQYAASDFPRSFLQSVAGKPSWYQSLTQWWEDVLHFITMEQQSRRKDRHDRRIANRAVKKFQKSDKIYLHVQDDKSRTTEGRINLSLVHYNMLRLIWKLITMQLQKDMIDNISDISDQDGHGKKPSLLRGKEICLTFRAPIIGAPDHQSTCTVTNTWDGSESRCNYRTVDIEILRKTEMPSVRLELRFPFTASGMPRLDTCLEVISRRPSVTRRNEQFMNLPETIESMFKGLTGV